ncbi:Bsp6I family type II restriction endonuclease [Priestia megaterium]|uniref:Bsp6I family type II restriction endonuclease n=1 Tax=Priestia megaterium TaxID=1404 RepID=UPI002E22FDEA|nr:Bsp6I family type II restriction endonuclease [Priestia megaterium]
MKTVTVSFKLPEGIFTAPAQEYEMLDKERFRSVYENWRKLSLELVSIGGRAINLPEGLSEGLFCIEMETLRVSQSIPRANTSFDCYRESDHARIQVKACSVLPDLTSFGPKSVWDEIYFMDFYRDGKWDGTFDIYYIDSNLIYNHKVNNNETFIDQQKAGKRPRLSIYDKIIRPLGLSPIKTGSIYL